MLRRKRDGRVFTAMLLPALLFLCTAAPPRAQEQKQQEQQPPLRRMRRVMGDQPKAPARPSDTQAPAGDDDDDVVRVDTDLANILLTAIDKDRRFVTTLRREDVHVF